MQRIEAFLSLVRGWKSSPSALLPFENDLAACWAAI